MNDHMSIWEAERYVPATESAWLKWIGEVESILGHNADGDQATDGYSMDGFFGLFKAGVTPTRAAAPVRLEYLRSQIEAECISMGELLELQELAEYIDPTDVQLLEWAGVPEFPVIRSIVATQTLTYDPEETGYYDWCKESCQRPTEAGFLEWIRSWLDEDFKSEPDIEYAAKVD